MKRFPFYLVLLLALTLIIAVMPTEAEASIYDDTVRLHILAASDSDEDQALKLAVRDMILEEFGESLCASASKAEAGAVCGALLTEIEEATEEFILGRGYGYDVDVTLGEEWYETREYEDFSLPRGYYTSLRVLIGGGEGKNWWCVMYPPLCTAIATESAPGDDGIIDYTDEEIRLIEGGRRQVKFKILEILSGLFGQRS